MVVPAEPVRDEHRERLRTRPTEIRWKQTPVGLCRSTQNELIYSQDIENEPNGDTTLPPLQPTFRYSDVCGPISEPRRAGERIRCVSGSQPKHKNLLFSLKSPSSTSRSTCQSPFQNATSTAYSGSDPEAIRSLICRSSRTIRPTTAQIGRGWAESSRASRSSDDAVRRDRRCVRRELGCEFDGCY